MPAQFLILSKSGEPVIRDCVRIAKKSLVFSESVDGKIQVPKGRCYYYNKAEQGRLFLELRALFRDMEKEKFNELIAKNFKQVTVKTTHF